MDMQKIQHVISCLIALFFLNGCGEKPITSVDNNSARLKGIDVSHYQGAIDWAQVNKSDVEFVFIKATQGKNTVDPHFKANWQGSKQVNLLRGVYHYLDPSIDATKQAQHFLATTESHFGELPPVVDIEAFEKQSAADVVKSLTAYISVINKVSLCAPIIYSSSGFLNDLKYEDFGEHILWLADYNPTPKIPHGWKVWTFWQFKSNGKIQGIASDVDVSYFARDRAALEAMTCKKK
jgi:lysozyme